MFCKDSRKLDQGVLVQRRGEGGRDLCDQTAQSETDERLFPHGQFFPFDGGDNEIRQYTLQRRVIFKALPDPTEPSAFPSGREKGMKRTHPVNALEDSDTEHQAPYVCNVRCMPIFSRHGFSIPLFAHC